MIREGFAPAASIRAEKMPGTISVRTDFSQRLARADRGLFDDLGPRYGL